MSIVGIRAHRLAKCAFALLLAAASLPLLAPPARAAITVDTTVDHFGDGPGCTLRDAIHAANINNFFDFCDTGTAGLDVIILPAGTYHLTVGGALENDDMTGDLDVKESIEIRGAGMTKTIIDATGLGDRVLDGLGGASVTLKDLTIQGGDAGGGDGGGIRKDGASGGLTLVRVRVRDNDAGGGGGISIPNAASLTIRHSLIKDNRVDGSANGGGIYHGSLAALTIEDSAIVGNEGTPSVGCGSPGGGLSLSSDDGVIRRSLIAGNSSGCQDSAGLYNGGTLEIIDSTVSGNTGTAEYALRNDDTLTLRRTTVSGIKGISNYADLTIAGSILEADFATCQQIGTYVSGGRSVFDDGGCGPAGPGDLLNTEPKLRPLADNGGPTRTHALRNGSPARGLVPGADCGPTDQRGAPRSGPCDAGAYEYVLCRGVVANRIGTSGNDVLVGTGGRDGFMTFGGKDVARGKGGNDTMCLGPGNDKGYGGAGSDTLVGQQGNDLLKGQAGNDDLLGGPGKKDRCVQGAGTGATRGCEI